MDKCYDDNFTFVEFYTLCRRLSPNPGGESTSTPQVRFDLLSTPQVLAAEVKVPGSSMSASTLENTGIVKSPHQWKSSHQWHSPPRRSNASYKGSPNWRSNNRLTSSPSGADSPDWRGNGGSSPRGSSSPNWRNRDKASSNRAIGMGLLKRLSKIWLLSVVSLATDSKLWYLRLIMVSRLCDQISIWAFNHYINHCLHWLLAAQSDLLGDLNSKAALVRLLVGGARTVPFMTGLELNVFLVVNLDIFRMSAPVDVTLLVVLRGIGLRWFVLAARSLVIINFSVRHCKLLHLRRNCWVPQVRDRAQD